MSFAPDPEREYKDFNYIEGTFENSIAQNRLKHLDDLNRLSEDTMLLALRDIDNNMWTKHLGWWKVNPAHIRAAYDIHRNIIWNEIVIESDYKTYEENYDVSRIIGAILEDKGFVPHYYYSGSKSIHIHIYIDFKNFYVIDMKLQENIMKNFTKSKFTKDFIKWLRIKVSKMWDMKKPLERETDEQVSGATTHMIRAELSRNKIGYKTFLGYKYKDLSSIPMVCNPESGLYPTYGEIIMSNIKNPQELIEEFLRESDYHKKKTRVQQKSRSLMDFFNPTDVDPHAIKPCIEFILSPEFRISAVDGFRRACYLLANELVPKFGKETALARILEWNNTCGAPLRVNEIEYQCSRDKFYTLTCDYVHKYLESLGFREEQYHK